MLDSLDLCLPTCHGYRHQLDVVPTDTFLCGLNNRAEPGVQPHGGILPQPLSGGFAPEGGGRGLAARARGQAAGRRCAEESPY